MNDSPPAQQDTVNGPLIPGARILVWVVPTVFVIALGLIAGHLNTQLADVQKQLAQSAAAATQAQAELAQAKAASAQLQSQLQKADSQQTDLQTQLDQSKVAADHLQSLADEEKAHGADLQSQLDKAKAQVSDMQTQIADDSAGSAALLEQTKSLNADTQAQLKKSQDDISQLQSWFVKARHLPVTTAFEKVDGGRSFTLHVSNLYAQPLSVGIAITGAVNTRTQKNSIDGSATLDVEKLTAGENVVISSDGYDPVTLSVQ